MQIRGRACNSSAMANVSLAAGAKPLGINDMIKDVEDGIYIVGDGSFSIDQQRYNAQFGGQLFYEIKNGKITEMIEDVAYQMRTPEFWNACVGVCDQRDFRYGGSFSTAKDNRRRSLRCHTALRPPVSTELT